MNKKVVNVFFQTISVLMIALLAITAYYSLFADGLKNLYLGKLTDFPMAYLIMAVLILGAAVFLTFRFIDRFAEKWHALIFWGILAIAFAGQMVILFGFDVYQITDAYIVQDQAKALALGYVHDFSQSYPTYFEMYGNNSFLLYCFAVYFKLAKALNIHNDAFVLAAMNVFFLDLSLIFEYRTAVLLTDRKTALKIHLMTSLNPFSAVFLYWAYTLNFSIPLMTAIGYLVVVLYKKPNLKWYWNVCLGVLLGCTVVWGYYMRPTAVFPFIAGLICAGLLFTLKCSREYLNKFPWKRVLPIVLAMVLAMGVNYVGLQKLFQVYHVDNSRNFPLTHWVMMGLHGDGSFQMDDVNFTYSFETPEEMKAANIEEIKSTLKEMGVSGFVSHLLVKIQVCWSDGSAGYQDRLKASDHFSSVFTYIAGDQRDIPAMYTLAYRTLTLLMSIVGLIHLMKKKRPTGMFLITVTLFGGYFFYLFWEIKSAYCVPFLYCLGFLSGVAADPMQEKLRSIRLIPFGKKLNRLALLGIILLAFTVVLSLAHYEGYVKEDQNKRVMSILMGGQQFSRHVGNLRKTGKELTQEFYIKENISRIAIPVKTYDGDATYRMTLYNGAGEAVATRDVKKSNVSKNDNFLTWTLDYTPQGPEKEKMKLSIRAIDGEADSIGFPYRFSLAMDQYEGDRALDGEFQRGDLFMSVYTYEEEPYASQAAYVIFWGILIAFEGFCIWFTCLPDWKKRTADD